MSKTHYKENTDSPYLGSWDLPDYKDIVLTIKEAKSEMTQGLKDNSQMNVAYFKEEGFKPMLLNSTNAKRIKLLARSPYLEDWAGQRVQIYVERNVKAFGELHDALRIRPTVPPLNKPKLTPKSEKWTAAKEAVKNGSTIDVIRKHYDITDEHFKLLSE